MAPEQGLQGKTSKSTEGILNIDENPPMIINATTTMTTITTTTTATVTTPTVNQQGATDNKSRGGQSQNAQNKMKKIKTSWVSYLNKAQLVSYLRECGMDDNGSVEELRRRLATYINGGHYSAEVASRLMELQVRHQPGPYSLCVPVENIRIGSVTDRSATDGSQVNTFIPQLQSVVDPSGQPRSVFDPSGQPRSVFDPSGQPRSVADPPGQTSQQRQGMDAYHIQQDLPMGPEYNQHAHYTRQQCSPARDFTCPRTQIPEVEDRTFDRVRTWGLKFNNQTDPIDFIERVEELARSQRVPLDQVPFTLSESFCDSALAWWRNRRHEWFGWENFKQGFLKFFLPTNFWDDLEDTIRPRLQREDEPFKDFALALETLMRHTHYDAFAKLERIYKNSLPALRLLVKRREFETLDELTDLISHIEATRGPIGPTAPLITSEVTRNLTPKFNNGPKQISAHTPQVNHNNISAQPTKPNIGKPVTAAEAERIKNPKEACHKCGRHGHTRAQCKNPTRFFCWNCGKVDTLTKDCCPNRDTRLNIVHAQGSAGTHRTSMVSMSEPEIGRKSIRCKLTTGNQVYSAILDTGSWHSYIHEGILTKLPDSAYTQHPCSYSVLLATGCKDKVNTMVEISLIYENKVINHNFLVLKNCTDSIILGMDLLERIGLTLTLGSKTTKFGIHTQLNRLRAQQTRTTHGQNPEHMTGQISDPRPDQLIRKKPEKAGQSVQRTIVAQHTPGNVNESDNIEGIQEAESVNTDPSLGSPDEPPQEGTWPHVPEEIRQFLAYEVEKFKTIQGVADVGTHKIRMKDDIPIKQRYYPRNPAQQEIINEKVDELLERGLIEPSTSPYSAPVVLVRKKNNQWRMCVDYRQLNAKSITDAYPLPRIHHILDRLRNAKYISSLDLKDGYWQIALDEASRPLTAFTVPGRGLFQWKVLPFGLHSAPATFQRALDGVIGIDLEPNVFAYLDDIIIHNETLEEHINTLTEVFRRLRAANLRINPDKCDFFKQRTKYLGHVISEQGIHTDPDKVAAIQALPAPTNVKELRRCLGIASWYRRFVPDFSTVSRPMTDLLKKGKHFKWGPDQQASFDQLKERLTRAPVLTCPDFSKTFKLQTDASDVGLGAVLTQDIDDQEHVIAYASRHLNPAEKNYSPMERECLAIVWAIRKMREYLEGYHFAVITDHRCLLWLNSIENPTGRVARWALELQQHDFEVHYRKGKLNVVADALSRQPVTTLNRLTIDHTNWPGSKMEEVQKNPQAFPGYVIENDRLYRHFPSNSLDDDRSPWKLCVPKEERLQVLKEAHDETTAGHQGIRKTIKRITNRYYWPGMFRNITRYVRACQVCQRYKTSQQAPAGLMLTHLPEEPWATVCADFVGPLPRSKHGHTTLLVLQDKFTKWIELIPLRSATSDGAIKGIRNNIISRFGVPKLLITDNGTQFVSTAFRRALEEWGIRHQLTAPYTPQENAVERANRVIKTMIAQFCERNQRTWDEALPEISLALNTSVSESTGFSPAYLVQGREPRMPRNLFDQVTPGTGTVPETGTELATRLQDIFLIVQQNLQQASHTQAKFYNLRHRDWKPHVGQLVWVRDHPLSKGVDGFAAKLAPKYDGPYEVVSFKSKVIVCLRATTSDHQRTAHVRDLKEYASPFAEDEMSQD